MECGKTLVFAAWALAVACGGTTTTVDDGEGSGGGSSSSGGASSTGGKASTGGTATGGKLGAGGGSASGGSKAVGGAGGLAASGGTAGSAGAAGAGTGGITPGCDPIPTEPQYTCKVRGYIEGDCLQVEPVNQFGANRVLPGYPPGCEVILPQQDGFSRCGPQRCTCREPLSTGGTTGVWECPL